MAGRREQHVISVEELLSRKVNAVRTEAGETSSCGGRDPTSMPIRRVIELQDQGVDQSCELKKERFEKLRKVGAATSTVTPNIADDQTSAKPKIQKAPLLLKDRRDVNFDKYFKPRIVALGPIHHDTDKKYRAAEDYKLRMASCFVQESGKVDEFLYDVVEKSIGQLRQCFEEEVTEKYDDQALAWMLFVDGSAILQFIYYNAFNEKCKDLKMKQDQMVFWQQDLFLLENQLPYQLLEDLMNSSVNGGDLKISIKKFMNEQVQATAPQVKDKTEKGLGTDSEKPIHLLDLLRTRIIGDKNKKKTPDKQKAVEKLQSYRNVEELKAAGIHVRPPPPWKRSGSLTTITFDGKLNFYLRLSPMIVDDSTGPKFMNLIAYEMCPDFYNDFEITSYISFLDSLIDNTKDVMELRNAGILQNHLGSDKEVAKLFNEIGTDLVPDPDAYTDVKDAIQNRYDSNWKIWIAEAIHDHFSSPWTFLAFSAAIIVLGLTFIQTWFAFKEDRSGNSRPRVRRWLASTPPCTCIMHHDN